MGFVWRLPQQNLLVDQHVPTWNHAKMNWTKLCCEWKQIGTTKLMEWIGCTNFPRACQEVVWISSDLFHYGISSSTSQRPMQACVARLIPTLGMSKQGSGNTLYNFGVCLGVYWEVPSFQTIPNLVQHIKLILQKNKQTHSVWIHSNPRLFPQIPHLNIYNDYIKANNI